MAAVAVSTTPVLIPNTWITIYNVGAVTAYYSSDPAVSSTTGVPIPTAGQINRYTRHEAAVLYLVTASGTADIRYYTDAFAAE